MQKPYTMEHHYTCSSLDELPGVVAEIKSLVNSKLVLLYGPMGAGKTTFIKAFCEQLSVTGVVSSPTFSLVNTYNTSGFEPVYHFDFYRIKDAGEAWDMGYEEYFYSGYWCLVEWPEKVSALLPHYRVEIHISVQHGIRHITLKTAPHE